MTEFDISRDAARAVIRLHDKLTAPEVPALQGALKQQISQGARELVFDMAATTILDSTGIGLLIAATNSMAAANGTVRAVNVSPDILKLLRSMRLVDRLNAAAAT